jgi:adenylate cyclase class IV
VRIHLDRVQGLGSFLEFEAIVGPDGDAAARGRLDRLARAFGVTAETILRASYGDLVLGKD